MPKKATKSQPKFDESKYPDWLFKKEADPMVQILKETDEEEKKLLEKYAGLNPEEFDVKHAEHRTYTLEKEMGLDIKRTGPKLYDTSTSSFNIEMNLHNAGRPL